MQNKTNLVRTAAAVVAGFILGTLVLQAPWHTEARAADDLFDQLIGDGSSAIQTIPLQVSRDSWGLAMVDTQNQTVWIYEIASHKPGLSQLRLLAARSWQYDRQLTEFNSGEPSPQYIKNFLEGMNTPKPGGESPALETQTP